MSGEHGKNNTLAYEYTFEISWVHMSQAWESLPVPAIGYRSAANCVVSSVVFIEFGRSSCKHRCGK